MKWWEYLLLSGLGLLILLGIAVFQTSPGYMDAEYYYTTALRIANGEGLTERFLWNYLGDIQALPSPSYGYWMPLASFLALGGIKAARGGGFAIAQAGSILIGVSIPSLAAALAHTLTKKRKTALFAGTAAVFSSFYLPFLSTTDTFGLYMLFGGLFFLLLSCKKPILTPLGLGAIAALMHLARADGIFWLAVALLSLVIKNQRLIKKTPPDPAATPAEGLSLRVKITPYFIAILGYLLVFGPWMLRNCLVFGSPFGAGGLKALWITSYDELYTYPASQLTFTRWWERGIQAMIQDSVWALGQNLQTALAVQGQILLAPLLLLGAWKLRRNQRVFVAIVAWFGTLGLMTIVFPFPGARGGFFHSGSAFQPLLWALAAVGLDALIIWGAEHRSWLPRQAWGILGTGIILLLVALSGFIIQTRVIGDNPSAPVWNNGYNKAQKLEKTLQSLGAAPEDAVMVNNPPGYSLVSQRPIFVIPNGDVSTLLSVARHYHVKYLILEENHPQALEELYTTPASQEKLAYLFSTGTTHFFRLED